MANSLLRIKSKFPVKNLVSHILQKSSVEDNACSWKWRSIMNIAINTETDIRDVLPVEESYQNNGSHPVINPHVLKQKEKADWRYLTMEEKRQLYHMSLNQSFCDTIPTDEWKKILGGTFIAMGLMTMGIYVWFTQFGFYKFEKALEIHKSAPHPELMMDFVSDKVEAVPFDSQPRH